MKKKENKTKMPPIEKKPSLTKRVEKLEADVSVLQQQTSTYPGMPAMPGPEGPEGPEGPQGPEGKRGPKGGFSFGG